MCYVDGPSRDARDAQPSSFGARHEAARARTRHRDLVLVPEGHEVHSLAFERLDSGIDGAPARRLWIGVPVVEQCIELRVVDAPAIGARGWNECAVEEHA